MSMDGGEFQEEPIEQHEEEEEEREKNSDYVGNHIKLPGHGDPPSGYRYKCPHCSHSWSRGSLDDDVPNCPVHHCRLVRDS